MPEFLSSWNYVFLMRLALAGVLGAAIGFERECRAKEAGTRTHFLVAVGSCLMMIVSQWGFQDVTKMVPEWCSRPSSCARKESHVGYRL